MTQPNDTQPGSYIKTVKYKLDQQFINVKMEWLKFNRSYDFDLYVYIKNQEQYVLFCRKNLTLTKAMAEKVHKKKIFVDKRDEKHFHSYMEENIVDIIKDASKPLHGASNKGHKYLKYNKVHYVMDRVLFAISCPHDSPHNRSTQSKCSASC